MEQVFDREKALKRTMGDEQLLVELIDFTLKDMPGLLELLEDYLSRENAFQLKETAHKLKGSAGTIGADRLFQVSFDLEQLASAENLIGSREALNGVKLAAEELMNHPDIGELRS